MQKNINKFTFNGEHLRNIKSKFEEKTGVQLEHTIVKRFKLHFVIAVTLIAALFLMSATGYYVLVTYKVFDADGNFSIKNFWERQGTRPSNEVLERLIFEDEFFRDTENTFGIILYGNGDLGIRHIKRAIYDYDELQKYIDGDIIKLSGYIPAGYEFSNAMINFYLDENFKFETAELINRVEKFGNTYEKYYIPENPKNISELYVAYMKEENGKEMWIWYNIWLGAASDINVNIGGLERTEGEILQMPQFDRNLFLTTPDYINIDGINYTHRTFDGIKIIPTITYLRVFSNRIQYDAEYGTVRYQIDTNFLSRDEIIKMAESIK